MKNLSSEGIKGKHVFNWVVQSAGKLEGAHLTAPLPSPPPRFLISVENDITRRKRDESSNNRAHSFE